MIKVRVPATSANLGPGFDCLGIALSLYNHITLDTNQGDRLKITATGSCATPNIPRDETNLVYKAIKCIFDKCGHDASSINLHLELESPLARGLGSSASAIAGGMFAANEFLGCPLSMDELAAETTAMEGHPDNVVPCLVGGLTASLVVNDKVMYRRTATSDSIRYVVFIPDYELETSVSRGVMPKQVSMKDAVFNSARIPFVISSLESGNLVNLESIMDDRLHQPYRIPLIKGYEVLQQTALKAGASAVCISGAGPTILSVCSVDTATNVAASGVETLSQFGVNAMSRILKADLDGCVNVSK